MTNVAATRVLSQTQTKAFDVEYVDDQLWSVLKPALVHRLGGQSKRVLDVGGGNGVFIDRVLEAFPTTEATVVEPDPDLVKANRPSPRKAVVQSSFQQLSLQDVHPVDVVCFNWVLHHFVVDSYEATARTQRDALSLARKMLRRGGRLIVFENLYDGWLFHDLPGRLIYEFTSKRRLAPVIARLGANTAGVGVCFHSERGWRELFARAGLRVERFTHCYTFGELSRLSRLALSLREPSVGMFELAAD